MIKIKINHSKGWGREQLKLNLKYVTRTHLELSLTKYDLCAKHFCYIIYEAKDTEYCQHVVTWCGKKDLSIIIQPLLYAIFDERCLPCPLPSSALNPPLGRHTYSHIVRISSLAFIIHCF